MTSWRNFLVCFRMSELKVILPLPEQDAHFRPCDNKKDVSRIEHIAILLVLAPMLVCTLLRYIWARRGDKTR